MLGIILGAATYVFCSFKRINLFLSSVFAAMVVSVFAGGGPRVLYALMTETYIAGFTGFISRYFLVFCLSAIFGRCMEQSGCARKIGRSLANLARRSKKNSTFYAALILPVFYFFLSLSGINGFVVVFTVLAIARELWHEADVPWELYPYGSAGICPALMLAGSLSITNVMTAEGFGVGYASMPLLSIVCGLVCAAVIAVMLRIDLGKLQKKGVGFYPSGRAIMELEITVPEDDRLPPLACAVFCLAVPFACLLIFKATAVTSLLLGTVCTCVFNYRRFDNLISALSNAVAASAVPIITVCGAAGFGAVIKAVPGFSFIYGALDRLPAFWGGVAMNLLFCSLIGSSSSHFTVILPDLVAKFTEAGLSAELGQRFATMSIFTYMVPHNSGPVNAITLSRIEFAPAAWKYFKITAIPGACAFLVAFLAWKLGLAA